MSDTYVSPLSERYASKEMQRIFSADTKFQTWRKLWIALAEAEQELGLPIKDEQIEEMKAHITDIDYDKAREYEKKVRHDVMAHVLTFGDACPKARPIIHLGATSAYVDDNTDIIQLREAMLHIKGLLLSAMHALSVFADKYKDTACLAFTHFQAAQPTTVGKRATLWLHDLMLDYYDLEYRLNELPFFGCKGTTGTGASFLTLFNGDYEKVKKLELIIADKMGFDKVFPVSGQTYTRKLDFQIIGVLAGIAQSAAKFSNDTRLLSHMKEFDEPFESGQIGSSAMAYKRNPMRSERMASLARYVMCGLTNTEFTEAGQWFERTLDDSANRRITLPEAFLATDAILQLYINIISGCRVYDKMIQRHLEEELPFMATENILMYCVEYKHGDRQTLHEAIRKHSVAAGEQVKLYGGKNDLIERIVSDPVFSVTEKEISELLDPSRFIGCAPMQTEEFLSDYIWPILNDPDNKALLGAEVNINV